MWKDFFYFTKRERTGMYVLVAGIVVVVAIDGFLSGRSGREARELTASERREILDFQASVRENAPVRYDYSGKFYANQQPVVLSAFDPNVADSTAFIRLGLKPYIARNILRYRAKGGRFRTPESFAKIYGITPEQFRTLLPYIVIGEQFRPKRDTVFIRQKADSAHYFKYPAGTVIELNGADTAELKKIPGIGSGLARMIVGYRSRLGGFYKPEQLQEVNHVPQELHRWFSVNPAVIRKINLNRSGFERLTAHPYLSFYQAKVIVEYRKKKGPLKSLSQLALYEEFTKADLERIAPYVEF